MDAHPNSKQQSHFFVSYSRSDRLAVDQLVKYLRDHGYELWMDVDTHGIEAGEDWRQELVTQMSLSDGVVACVSPDFLTSPYCRSEIEQAIVEEKPIFPIIIRRLDQGQSLNDFGIGHIQFVDVTQYYEHEIKRYVAQLPRPLHGKRVWVQRFGWAVGLVVVLLAVLLGVLFTSGGSGMNDDLPTNSADPMPSGFNVAVAGFSLQQANGTMAEATAANEVSDVMIQELQQVPEIDHLRSWRADNVDHILESDPAEREAHARQIAETLNADVVVYGRVIIRDFETVVIPEFYIGSRLAAFEPELADRGMAFGDEIVLLNLDEDSPDLDRRVAVIRLFMRGLAEYLHGEFSTARQTFSEAIAVGGKGLEILHVFAGNAAMREPDITAALMFYSSALITNPTYSRALGGVGSALYALAVQQQQSGDYESSPDIALPDETRCATYDYTTLPDHPQMIAMLADLCLEEAIENSDDLVFADLDAKLTFIQGQVYAWQATVGYADSWPKARARMETVLQLYTNSSGDRQARIRLPAAHAHAYLGLQLVETAQMDVEKLEEAKQHYQEAIALLEEDVNRAYNTSFTDSYQQRIESIDSVLAVLKPAP